ACRPEQDRPATGAEHHRPAPLSCGDERGQSAEEPAERDAGQLPVPVVREVDEEAGVGTERDGHERLSSRPEAGERDRQDTEDRAGPGNADVCERLQVDAVGVPDALDRGPVAVPVLLEAPGAAAEDGMRLELAPGDVPELRASVAGQAEESAVQVARGGEVRGEVVVTAFREMHRAAAC